MSIQNFPDDKLHSSAAVALHVDALVNRSKIHWSDRTPGMLEDLGAAIEVSPDLELRLKWAKFVVMDLLGGAKKQETAQDKLPVFNFNFNRAAGRMDITQVDPDTGDVTDVFSMDAVTPSPQMLKALGVNADLGGLDV